MIAPAPTLEDLYGPEPTPRRGRPRLEDTQPIQPRAVGGRPAADLYELRLDLPDTTISWQVHSLAYGQEGIAACERGEFGVCQATLTSAEGQTLSVSSYAVNLS